MEEYSQNSTHVYWNKDETAIKLVNIFGWLYNIAAILRYKTESTVA